MKCRVDISDMYKIVFIGKAKDIATGYFYSSAEEQWKARGIKC